MQLASLHPTVLSSSRTGAFHCFFVLIFALIGIGRSDKLAVLVSWILRGR
jgi:hypothetical protein